jgi:regulator of ribosome biosynthesis
MDYDLAKEARAKRKERMAKNERQHMQNLGTGARKSGIDRTLATTRTSTASMGKFDRVLEGEKKLRGVKRKVPSPPFSSSFPYSLTTRSSTRLKNPSMRR